MENAKKQRERADVLLTASGQAPSRERARALIMEGCVFYGEVKVEKPGQELPADAVLTVRGGELPFVSRGGLKLEKACAAFSLALEGRVCMDIGASTGGFTDCMLKRGAVKVYAVDVGYGQLAWKLRCDPRVVCMERTNIRYVTLENLQEPPSFISVDVSFISLSLVLPVARALLDERGEAVCLIKPQFEAGRGRVGKKGVVRDPEIHREVIERVTGFAREAGFVCAGLDYSPVRGPEGNIEYLLYLTTDEGAAPAPLDIGGVVAQSHARLGGE